MGQGEIGSRCPALEDTEHWTNRPHESAFRLALHGASERGTSMPRLDPPYETFCTSMVEVEDSSGATWQYEVGLHVCRHCGSVYWAGEGE